MAKKNIVRFGDWISGGWNLFTAQWQVWSLMGLVFFLPLLIVIGGGYAVFVWQMISAGKRGGDPTQFFVAFGAGLALLLFIILFWIAFVSVGMFRAAFKQLDGQKIELSDVWSGGDLVGRMTLTILLVGLLTVIGALLCYLPAFIVGGVLYFAQPLVVRKGLSATEALSASYELAKQDWLMFTLFAFVVSLIAQIGVYACYIGIIFSLPLTYTIGAFAYRDCFEPGTAPNAGGAAPTAKLCTSCGKPLPMQANFCEHCGAGQV
jgi:hypothetical protein